MRKYDWISTSTLLKFKSYFKNLIEVCISKLLVVFNEICRQT